MAKMSIEKVLLSKNRSAFDRLIKMFRSLIVKNEVEADNCDTQESIEAYAEYEAAYEEVDSIKSYTINETDFMYEGFTPLEAARYMKDLNAFQHLINARTDIRALNLISKKRKERIDSYVELNSYYKSFTGIPSSEKEYIEVTNEDKFYAYEKDTIYLHEARYETYPLTFNKLFVDRQIQSIYDNYDYVYLKFLEKPLTPYYIHNKKQFEICYYKDGILQSNEIECFFESYNIAREEILSFDYIDAFEKIYNAYVEIMFLFILFYTFALYCSKSLQRYAIKDYTDDEMYDILDSNNLSVLKTLNIGLIRNVINALPDLKANAGTRNIIDIIFDIVSDNSVSVKEYYLEKKYPVDDNGNITLDVNKTYDKNVELVFRESLVRKGSDASDDIDRELSYEGVTDSDDTWGETQNIDSYEIKSEIKKQIKKELLEKDFSSVLTKYISISKIIDMYNKVTILTNKLGIFYQLNENKSNFLKSNMTMFDGFEVSALSLYAAWCLIFASLNGLTDPDYIVKEASEIEDVLYLRKSDQLSSEALASSHIEIDLGNGFKRTLGDYLTIEEIKSNLVRFSYTETTSISDVLNQYDENYAIIKAIDEKLNKISNYDEYTVWSTIKKANMISKNIKTLFDGFTLYSEYIKHHDILFWKYIEPVIINREPGYKKTLKDLYVQIQEAYRDYISGVTQGQILLAVDEKNLGGGENIEEVGVLFNEFMSYYTQILRQDFNVKQDDPGSNSLFLLYAKIFENIITEETDAAFLTENIVLDRMYESGNLSDIEIFHYLIDYARNYDNVEIELLYEQFKYIDKSLVSHSIELAFERYREISTIFHSTEISLVESVSFK
jgi:hypothetical protein